MRFPFVALLGSMAIILETSRVVGQPAANVQEPARHTVTILGSSVPGTLTLTHLNPPPDGRLELGGAVVLSIRCSVPPGFVMFFHLEGANAPGLPAIHPRIWKPGPPRQLVGDQCSARDQVYADKIFAFEPDIPYLRLRVWGHPNRPPSWFIDKEGYWQPQDGEGRPRPPDAIIELPVNWHGSKMLTSHALFGKDAIQRGLTSFFVPYILCAVLLGPLTGWLSALRWMPLRFFAVYPWRVVWLGSALLTGSVLLLFTVLDTRWTSFTAAPVYLILLVTALATVQGLRITWLRSWWKGASVLLAFLLFTTIETVSIPRSTADFHSHFYAAFSLAPAWALAAWIAQQVGRRFVPAYVPGGS